MSENNLQTQDSWPERSPSSFDELRKHVDGILASAKCGSGATTVAWRGHAKSDWQLVPTLDRELENLKLRPEDWYGQERKLLEEFREAALKYSSVGEKRRLQGDWGAMAVARHAGLATRLLDWTYSPWVALWFASHAENHRNCDGVLWWFDMTNFNEVVHKKWDKYGVETKATALGVPEDHELVTKYGLDERNLEPSAFDPKGEPWICQLHYPFPCSRMAAQFGFATVCGKLGVAHDEAIAELGNVVEVPRGKILVPAKLKADAMAYLAGINIHAASLEYPALDECARQIMKRFHGGEVAQWKPHTASSHNLSLSKDTTTNIPGQ